MQYPYKRVTSKWLHAILKNYYWHKHITVCVGLLQCVSLKQQLMSHMNNNQRNVGKSLGFQP